MSERALVVLKFGSSVLRAESDLAVVTAEIQRHLDNGLQVVAVVSAIGESTEALIGRARALGHPATGIADDAPIVNGGDAATDSALAALLATGEATSAALVGLALDQAGVRFTVLDAGRVGPFTRGPRLDAEPYAFDRRAVDRALAERPVAILPGFVGRDESGSFSLLGRGGSDLTALFVAKCLDASRCRLLKDVDGVYESDPAAKTGRKPRRFDALGWQESLTLGGEVLQRKASLFAQRHRIHFEIGRCGTCDGTRIGNGERRLAS